MFVRITVLFKDIFLFCGLIILCVVITEDLWVDDVLSLTAL